MYNLDNIRIVMVNTTLPANIGSAARAMHTMGLSDLALILPKHPLDDSAYANAAGGLSVLTKAVLYDDLTTAIQDCSLIFAASARLRHLPRPVVTPREATATIANLMSSHPSAKIAILFGREDRGLTNEELALADFHIHIPANPDYPVLNVANAVQIIASHIYEQLTYNPIPNKHRLDLYPRTDWDEPAITHAQKTQLEHEFVTLMTKLELADAGHLKDLPRRLSRLSSRLQLDQKEYALLRAVLAKVGQRL